MQRRRNVFPFLIAMLMIISKPFLKNHQRTRTKFISYLQGFDIIAISENTSKYDISDFKDETYRGVTLQQLWMLKPTTLPKKLHCWVFFFFFFLSFANFIRIDIKNNSWWIAHIILSKKVKELQKKQNKANHYENSTVDSFTIFWVVFRWTGISSCSCHVLKSW